MTTKRKQHKVIPIGMKAAHNYVSEQMTANTRGRRMGYKTSRALTLMLAYGVDSITASKAANDDDTRDQSAAHQLKWKAIERIKQFIELDLVKPVEFTGIIDPKSFAKVEADVKFLHECDDQQIAATKCVACYGAPLDEIEKFCDVKISHLVETVNNIGK